ncbi:tRNA dihydrouridine synthase B -like protein [Geoglobus ahangari]|uniref:tRNA dihydrouridine synthase B-like protein n=1 Tax=Geoglobus ahangari TaxID=113653 RepID=A0A0F7IF28_9EURY|nr:MJ0144 family RNA dihydrouridine synthase-like protein [Geoglobus ahangari]AKG91037.1 tRNA dihydrouridine synthase B -like protein [Geoglobus ahangari]
MIFPNRLVLSAMAGINDWRFVRDKRAGMVVLGGFNADRDSNEAAKRAAERGRREFVFSDPVREIERQISMLHGFRGVVAVNVRSKSLDGYAEVARVAGDHGAVVEINAHCRQPEFLEIGCGQSLLFNQHKLAEIVERASKHAEVVVKIRGGLDVDYLSLSQLLFDSGALMIHVDAMIPGGGADYELVKLISSVGNTIGNNSVVDVNSARRMLESGAKLVSLARAVLKDERIFDRLLRDNLLSSSVEVV